MVETPVLSACHPTNTGYVLSYNVISFGGPINYGGSGSIPASSVNVPGQTETFFALTTGTALGFDMPTPTFGVLVKQTNVTVTITAP